MAEAKWLTLRQVSEELGLHVETLREYVRTGQLVAHRFGRDYRVKREDLDRFIEERKVKPDDT